MRRAEKICAMLGLIGMAMIALNIAGGGFTALIAVSVLAVVYYFSPLLLNGIRLRNIFKKDAFKEVPAVAFIAAFFAGMGLCSVLLGSLFKLQLWPHGTGLIGVGLLLIAVSSAACYGISQRYQIGLFAHLIRRAAPVAAIGMLFYLTPTDTLIDIRYRNAEEAASAKETYQNRSNERPWFGDD